MKVEILFQDSSKTVIHEDIKNEWQEDNFWCLLCLDGSTIKYPVAKIFRIKVIPAQEDSEAQKFTPYYPSNPPSFPSTPPYPIISYSDSAKSKE